MWHLEAKTLGLEASHAALQLIAEIDEFKGKWEALRALTGANKNTLKVRLRELTEAQQISRYGKARATWYEIGRGGLPQEGRR